MLLLDSCSMVNLIANEWLLIDIHKVEHHMHVHCNAGVCSTNLMATLGCFPEPVWHDPDGVTNIMSLNSMKKYYKVEYDNMKEDAIIVMGHDGTVYHFEPHGKGLYAYKRPRNHTTNWAFITTVKNKKDLYTQHEYKAALQVH